MKSIYSLYRIGPGPSSSHTMGPKNAALQLRKRYPRADSFSVDLYGSLARTGKGHLTDAVLRDTLGKGTSINWFPEQQLPEHPNGLVIHAYNASGKELGFWKGYSTGGGAVHEEAKPETEPEVYEQNKFADYITYAEEIGGNLWDIVRSAEGAGIEDFLFGVWQAMESSVEGGLRKEGILPGGLRLARKAKSFYKKARRNNPVFQRTGLLASYALSVAEENAAGGTVVTAPTCGSAGVLPSVLYYVKDFFALDKEDIFTGLATAAVVGNVVRTNASISGAAVGCQGEVGTACAMASAAACQLMGGSLAQIEYVAEMGMEHHLGLTCDPLEGLVQIPCIARNAVAAMRALDCADFSLLSDGRHRISFDSVVEVMNETGRDLSSNYKETSLGGLARLGLYNRRI